MNELNLFCFGTNIFVTIFCGVFLAIIPTLTRKAFLFGVKVPEEAQEHPEAKRMKKRYVSLCIGGMSVILALNIAQYILWPEYTLLAVMYFPLLIIVVQAAAYIPNWKKAVRLKAENNWAVSGAVFAELRSSHSRGNMLAVLWGYYIVSVVIVFVSVAVSLMRYPSLPDLVPTHFDINMDPDVWSPKTLGAILVFPLISLGTVLLMALVNVGIVKTKLQVSPQNPALSFAQHRQYRRLMGHGLGILTLGLAVAFAVLGAMTLWPGFKISFSMMMIMLLLPCLPVIIVPIKTGQGGCKLKPEITEADALAAGYPPAKSKSAVSGRGDDRFWILGLFYYNPDDPALLVEDRFGSNIGFNYAKGGVIAGVALAFLITVLTYVWITVRIFPMI